MAKVNYSKSHARMTLQETYNKWFIELKARQSHAGQVTQQTVDSWNTDIMEQVSSLLRN